MTWREFGVHALQVSEACEGLQGELVGNGNAVLVVLGGGGPPPPSPLLMVVLLAEGAHGGRAHRGGAVRTVGPIMWAHVAARAGEGVPTRAGVNGVR